LREDKDIESLNFSMIPSPEEVEKRILKENLVILVTIWSLTRLKG